MAATCSRDHAGFASEFLRPLTTAQRLIALTSMELSKVPLYIIVAVVGTIVTVACVRLIWLALGANRIRRAGPR